MTRSFVFASLFAIAGCGGDPTSNGVTGGTVAIVTSRDALNMTGAINTIGLSDKKVTPAIDTTLDSDNVVRVAGGKVYVLNRTHDNLRVYDGKTWAVESEINLGAGTDYVQDALPIDGNRVAVTFAGKPGASAVGLVDTTMPAKGVIESMGVPAIAADTDGKPEPGALYACNGLLYTPLGDYDSETTFAPLGPGRLAVLDPAQMKVVDVIQLHFQNPGPPVKVGSDCTQVLIAGAGPFGMEPGGSSGIEKVDLKTRTATPLVDGTVLQGSPSNLVVASAERAFMIRYYDLQTVMGPTGGYQILARGKITGFDPRTGAVTGDVSDAGGYIPFLDVSPDGNLWFAVDNLENVDTTGNLPAGVYVGKADGTKVTTAPIDIGQKPVAISFQ